MNPLIVRPSHEAFVKHSALGLLPLFLCAASLWSQETSKPSDYILGSEEQLEIVVHVWGEVKSPGEFRVPYETNLVELISKAGGPSEYANLSKVRLTRQMQGLNLDQEALRNLVSKSRAGVITEKNLEKSLKNHFSRRIQIYDVRRYLENNKGLHPPPVLQPGDVVLVPTNSWHRWRELVRVAHEVAVIASVYVWYLRSQQW